jgi:septal ring factor EnvC (AmiA/AmiB activator)
MHVVSNPHDPRIKNPCGPLRIFMLHDIQTIGALVPLTSAVIYFPHMASKKPTKKRRASLDAILSTVERGFAAVADDIADIKSKMATKDDIANLGGQLTSVGRELKSIRRDLDDLRENVENVSGFQKEIDHALERIAAIEKHLGLDKKIAA